MGTKALIKRWRDWRMGSKLLVVFVFLLVLPIGVLGYISAIAYSNSIEKNTVSYVSQVSDKMMVKLDDYIEDMKKISIIPSYLDVIKSGLESSNEFYESMNGKTEPASLLDTNPGVISHEEQARLNIQRQVGSSIYFMNNIKKGTNIVYLFDKFGHPYYVVKNTGIRTDLSSAYERWKVLAQEANGAPVLVSTQEVSESTNRKRYVFTVVRDIEGPSLNSIGMIAIDANIGVIENIVNDLDQVTQGTTLIVDQEDRVIFDSQKKYLSQDLSETGLLRQASGTEGSFHSVVDGEKELTIYRQSPVTGWKVFITIPEKHLMADALRTRNYTMLAAIAIVGFAMLISFVLIIALTRPLRSLARLMGEVQKGNLSVEFSVRRRDEVGMVGNAFNRMITRIKTLIEDIHQIEQRKKEVELESLQHQINPHFIYNTLESIRMTALLHDDSEVEDMAGLLGKLLRYSIHQGTETVPIELEWEHLKMYVQLLNYRYGERFTLELPEEDLSHLAVLKVLFQPIVENSINHGLDESGSPMVISIRYQMVGHDHVFTIADNGVGMDDVTLLRLRKSLRESDRPEKGRGIGLRNVSERVKLRYGNAYGLSVESMKGEGTFVIVRLPSALDVREGGSGFA